MLERRAGRTSPWLPLALLALLALLAILQFRWTGELGEAERDRLHAALEERSARTAEGFSRELSQIFLALSPRNPFADGGEVEAAAALATWRATTRHPGVVAELLRLDLSGPVPTARRLDAATATWSELPWPPPPASPGTAVAHALTARTAAGVATRATSPAGEDPGPPSALAPEIPAFLYPVFAALDRAEPGGREPSRPQPWSRPVTAWQVVVLDREALVAGLLGTLVREQFEAAAGHAGEDRVEVELPDGTLRSLLGEPGEPSPGGFETSRDLFHLLRGRDLRALARSSRDEGRPEGTGPTAAARGAYLRFAEGGDPHPSGWRLLVGRRDGTLDAVVTRTRFRNLALGLGVLAVLGAGLLVTVAAADRARRLARRELDFVAAISHELRTPIAAIRALGENLRDGLARDAERVREYATMILAESERLGGLVEGTLAAASGGEVAPARREPLAAAAVLRDAVARCASLPGSAGITVSPAGESDCAIEGDGEALVRALVNVLANALRFSGAAPLVEASVQRRDTSGRERIRFRIADRGIGIPRDELPHLSEPFFRGRRATELGIPGSGLGLFLVHRTVTAHDGTLAVEPRDGGGTVVTIDLPAAAGEKGPDGAGQTAADRRG